MDTKQTAPIAPKVLDVLRWLLESDTTEHSERLLLWALIMRCQNFKAPDGNSSAWYCWPSYRTLAMDTRMAPSTLKRAMVQLEAKKLVIRKRRGVGSNIYILNVEKLYQDSLMGVARREEIEPPADAIFSTRSEWVDHIATTLMVHLAHNPASKASSFFADNLKGVLFRCLDMAGGGKELSTILSALVNDFPDEWASFLTAQNPEQFLWKHFSHWCAGYELTPNKQRSL